MLDGAQAVARDGAQKAIYWRKGDAIWMAVVKTTNARDEVYLVTLHQTDAKEVKRRYRPISGESSASPDSPNVPCVAGPRLSERNSHPVRNGSPGLVLAATAAGFCRKDY